jgi:hypothetical protein
VTGWPTILGVDPGEHAYAAILRGSDLETFRVRGNEVPPVVATIQHAMTISPELVLVLEDQFYRQGPKANFKSLERLLWAAHIWEVLAAVYEIAVVKVKPATWQGPMLAVTSRTDDHGRKRSAKARSKEAAAYYFARPFDNDNEADAALIARWYRETHQ